MKTLIKKLTPSWALDTYHKCMAVTGHYLYGRPSDKMIVIGVTGTKGKSTTVNLISHLLEKSDHQTGFVTTANIKVGKKTWINKMKQTMPGRFKLHKLLARMFKAGARYAIVETSSEGIAQHRHWGIAYDILVFTNLTPEHIEAHGSFANYKKVKESLFQGLAIAKRKPDIAKTIVVNLDDEHYKDFLRHKADRHFGFAIKDRGEEGLTGLVRAKSITGDEAGSKFTISASGHQAETKIGLVGKFNVYNCLAALTVGLSQDIDLDKLAKDLTSFPGMPGRMEEIKAGQDFKVFVDYAHEPESLRQAMEAAHQITRGRVLVLTGAAGGGRDKSKRPKLGQLAAEMADIVVVANEDPYDEDPQAIIDQVAQGALDHGKKIGQDLFTIFDRREAIAELLSRARFGDVVLITGKGAEQGIVVANGKQLKHDDRQVAREHLSKQS